MAYVEKT